MTEQEAIEELKCYVSQCGTSHPEEIEIAIDALEKQISKKPVHIGGDGIRYTDLYRCPNCGQGFSGTGIADYCYHCGQKLDWESEDEQ